MQFARVAARHGIVSRRQLASWGVEHLRYRLRGTTDERTGEVLRVARELIAGVPARDVERMGPEVMAAILPRVYPQMLDEVHAHQDAGRADLHRQRRRQRRGRVAGPGARHGGRHRHPLRGRRRRQLHRPLRRALRLRPGQGRGDARPSPPSTRSTSPPPTPTPTRSPTCRCCARSATRSSVNPDPPLAEIAREEGWQTMRFERLGRRLVAIAVTAAGDRRRLRRLAHRRPPQAAAPSLPRSPLDRLRRI